MDRPYNHLDEADAMAVCPNDYVVCPLCTARAEVERLRAALGRIVVVDPCAETSSHGTFPDPGCPSCIARVALEATCQ